MNEVIKNICTALKEEAEAVLMDLMEQWEKAQE